MDRMVSALEVYVGRRFSEEAATNAVARTNGVAVASQRILTTDFAD